MQTLIAAARATWSRMSRAVVQIVGPVRRSRVGAMIFGPVRPRK